MSLRQMLKEHFPIIPFIIMIMEIVNEIVYHYKFSRV